MSPSAKANVTSMNTKPESMTTQWLSGYVAHKIRSKHFIKLLYNFCGS